MKIVEVKTKPDRKKFVDFPKKLYKEAAFCLFNTAREWHVSHGIEAMDGPINFGENDNNWGLLVEGFSQQGFGMPYNKKYYLTFFEEFGFKNYFEQYSYHKDI